MFMPDHRSLLYQSGWDRRFACPEAPAWNFVESLSARGYSTNQHPTTALKLPECQYRVKAPEGERVRNGELRLSLASVVGDNVQVALRIGLAIADGGREHAVAQRQNGGHRLDRSGCPERVSVHRLGGAHRQPIGVSAEDRSNGGRLGHVV